MILISQLLSQIPNNLEIYNIISPEITKKKENFKSELQNSKNKKESENNNELIDDKKNFKLQLGSLRSFENALKEYKKLTVKYQNFFKDESPIIEKIEFPDKGVFYRVKSYESFSKNEAQNICKTLILDNKKCLVIKND